MMVRTKTMFVHNLWAKKNDWRKNIKAKISLCTVKASILDPLPSTGYSLFWQKRTRTHHGKKISYLIHLSWDSVVHLLNMWEPEGAGRFSGWEEDLSLKGEHCPEDGVRTWDISTRKEKGWNRWENKGFRRIGKIKKRRKSEKCNCGGDDEE